MRARFLLVLAALAAVPASADDAPFAPAQAPDPATITVPNAIAAYVPGRYDSDDYWEYAYFHKPGKSYAAAYADIRQCEGYAATATPVAFIPKFVPYGETPQGSQGADYATNAYAMWGLVGGALASALIDYEGYKNARWNYRRCMDYLGYTRYGLDKTSWRALHDGNPADYVAREAVLASGPQPQAQAIEP